jgi:hypothetical protein
MVSIAKTGDAAVLNNNISKLHIMTFSALSMLLLG